MSCNACRASFDAAANHESTRVEFIDARHPLCECQVASVSSYSSGAVTEDETLVRILVTPIHVRGTKVKGAAFSRAETTGLSVVRDDHASDEVILQVAKDLVESARKSNGEKAGVLGVLLIKASLFRAVRADANEDPSYCVYDTALEHNPAHAEAFQRVHNCSADLILLRRATLQKAVEHTFVPTSEFRNGLLSGLGPSA